MKKNTRKICIPFDGFYDTLHSSAIDDAEVSIFEDHNGNLLTSSDKLLDRFYRVANYTNAYFKYSESYAENFASLFEIGTLKFDLLDSPLEHNFHTDRIFCSIDLQELSSIFDDTCKITLSIVAKERHTSSSGFSSFYVADWKLWGNLKNWDHNQLQTLLIAWLSNHPSVDGGEFDVYQQGQLMVDCDSLCYITDCLLDNPEALRLSNIASYLRDRAER